MKLRPIVALLRPLPLPVTLNRRPLFRFTGAETTGAVEVADPVDAALVLFVVVVSASVSDQVSAVARVLESSSAAATEEILVSSSSQHRFMSSSHNPSLASSEMSSSSAGLNE